MLVKARLRLPVAEDSFGPEGAEIAEGDDGDEDAERQADEAVADGEIGFVSEGVVKEDADDAEEGADEEGCHADGESHDEGGEPAEIADGRAEDVAVGEGLVLVVGCGSQRR